MKLRLIKRPIHLDRWAYIVEEFGSNRGWLEYYRTEDLKYANNVFMIRQRELDTPLEILRQI